MNSLFSFVINNAKNYKSKSIFFTTFFIITCILLIPITAFNVFFYINNSATLKKEFDIINTYNLNSTKSIVESTIRETEYFAIQTSLHNDIESFIFASESNKRFAEIQRKVIDYTKQFIYVRSYINSVYVFSEKNNMVIANQDSVSFDEYSDTSWYTVYEKMDMNETAILPRKYADRYPRFISVIRPVSIQNVGKTGCVVVNIDVEKMNKNVCNNDMQADIYKFFVVNEENKVLYSNILAALGEPADSIEELTGGKNGFIYSDMKSEQYGWKYISLMHTDNIAVTKNNILWQTLISTVIMVVLAAVVALLISIRLFQPFHDIIEVLNNSYTDYEINPKFKQNEVGLIINSIKENKGKYQQIEEELRYRMAALNKAQIVALQSQINPHFVNNMLEITNWTAIDLLGKNNKISAIIKALSNLMTVGLDFENYLIPVREELQHINIYSYLIGLGYDEKFNLVWEMDPGIEEYKIIKLTLQPILENTVFHGVDQSDNPIEVRIKGEIKERDLLFTISDNGAGIEPEKLKEIRQLLKEKAYFKKNRIGLNNVNKRIKLVCGEKYGLAIDSVLGEGTTVKILFPKITDEEENNNL